MAVALGAKGGRGLGLKDQRSVLEGEKNLAGTVALKLQNKSPFDNPEAQAVTLQTFKPLLFVRALESRTFMQEIHEHNL